VVRKSADATSSSILPPPCHIRAVRRSPTVANVGTPSHPHHNPCQGTLASRPQVAGPNAPIATISEGPLTPRHRRTQTMTGRSLSTSTSAPLVTSVRATQLEQR
jgi:hypothetical protein